MGDVVSLTIVPGQNYHAEADAILEGAKTRLTDCVIIGWDKDGELYTRSTSNDAETNLLLDVAKRQLMDGLIED